MSKRKGCIELSTRNWKSTWSLVISYYNTGIHITYNNTNTTVKKNRVKKRKIFTQTVLQKFHYILMTHEWLLKHKIHIFFHSFSSIVTMPCQVINRPAMRGTKQRGWAIVYRFYLMEVMFVRKNKNKPLQHCNRLHIQKKML